MKLNVRLKKLRKSKKMTQEQLSNKLGIKRSTYAKYETGENEPDYEMLQKLANFFDVSTDYLLGFTDNISSSKTDGSITDIMKILKEEKEPHIDGVPLTKEEREIMIDFAEMIKKRLQKNV